MRVSVRDFDTESAVLASAWLDLLLGSVSDAREVDVTTTYEWSESLRRSHLCGQPARIALAQADDGALVGLFPYFRCVGRVRGVPCRQLHAISQLYSGRNRLLAHDPVAFAEGLFTALEATEAPWDRLCLTVLDDSPSERALSAAAARRGYVVETVGLAYSPYIDLPASWDTCFSALPKKFRWLLRTSRQRMEELGRLEHRVFKTPAEVPVFIAAMFAVEKSSWKEKSGSSITLNERQQAFYHALALATAAQGWLRGHVLILDDEPLAYVLGISLGPVFHDLKESYKHSMREHSPAHVLKTFVLPTLIAEGITSYDFRGKCDEFKMKWTDRRYRRRELVIHSTTPRARLVRALGALRACLPGAQNTMVGGAQTDQRE